jgi:hypothetical protein
VSVIGCSGHQDIPPEALAFVEKHLSAALASRSASGLVGVCSLAAGADQLFARHVLAAGGALEVVIPAANYESTFVDTDTLTTYEELLTEATRVEICPFNDPGEPAFLYAGRRVVDRCDTLIAIWDGAPARGRGGTADIVSYARSSGRDVEIVWPTGTER